MSKHRALNAAVLATAVAATAAALSPSNARAQAVGPRVLGIDISEWQGNITQTRWNTVKAEGRDFAFIRSSRGGTTGFYDQNDASNLEYGKNTQGQRYDDAQFQNNITRATAAGIYAGPYHFARPDVITYTDDYGNTVAQTGYDEAIHFIQQAGAWMKPGYLLPVNDFEAGSNRSTTSLSNFHVEFANTLLAVKGFAPMVYVGQNYANNEINASVAAAMPMNWVARWPNQSNPHSIDVHNINPPASPPTANVYGHWSPTWTPANQTHPNPQPWHFWQYGSSNTNVAGISPVDVDVAHGDIEFLKDHLVPALLTTGTDANWSTLSNWNSDADPSGLGPAARLPFVDDTVILDRGAANPTITLSTGTHTIRKLFVNETLNVTGGSLSVGYLPYAPRSIDLGAGPITAQFSKNVTLSGNAAYSAHTTLVDANTTLSASGGALTFNTLDLAGGATPARIVIGGDVTLNPFAGSAAQIVSNGSGTSGLIDLSGGQRTVAVSDGAAPTDLTVAVPITNGSFIKAGPGAVRLTATNTMAGYLSVYNGTVTLAGPSGTLSQATKLSVNHPESAYTVHPAGALVLDNSSGNNNDRIGTQDVEMNGGTLAFIGNSTTEATGALDLPEGASTIAIFGAGSSTLAFGGFLGGSGSVNFTGVSGTNRVTFGGLSTGFIGAGAFVNGADYAVYDAGGYVRAMTTGAGQDDYATSITPDRHVRLTSSAAAVPTTSIRTLNLAGETVSLTLDANATVTLSQSGIIKSGGGASSITSAGGGSIGGARVNTVDSLDELTIAVPVSGTVTKVGAGTLVLGAGANSVTGLRVDQGTVRVAAANVIADDANVTIGHGATFDLNGHNETVGQQVLIHDGTLSSTSGNATLSLSGASPFLGYYGLTTGGTVSVSHLTLTSAPGSARIFVNDREAPTDLLISSVLQNGPGISSGVTKNAGGRLALTGNNTFTGPLSINLGVLSVNTINPVATAAQPLGASSASISLTGGGILEYSGPNAATLNRQLAIHADAGTIRSTAGPLTLASGVIGITAVGPGPTVTFDAAGGDIVVPSAIAAVSLTKTGPDTLTLSANNTYAGNTTLSAGTLAYSSPANLGQLSNTILFNGGTLRPTSTFTEPRDATLQPAGGTIDTPTTATFSGVFSGAGPVTKTGPGTLVLSNNHTFTGPVSVAAGTLTVNGSLHPSSSVRVTTGATAAGSGSIPATTLTTGGRVDLSPGATLSSLTVVGPTGGSWAGAGTVSGSATVNSGTLTISSGATLAAPTGVTVNGGGTLAGAGTVANNVTLASNDLYVAATNFSAGATIAGNLTVTGTSQGAEWLGQGAVTGTTTVSSKTLYVHGNLSGAGPLVLTPGTNLKGLGTVAKSITFSGNNRLGGHNRLYRVPGSTVPNLGTLTITTPVNWNQPNLFINAGSVSTPGDTVSGSLTVQAAPIVENISIPGQLTDPYHGRLIGAGSVTITPTGLLAGQGAVMKPVSLQGGTINFSSAGPLGPVGEITSTLSTTAGTWAGIGSVTGVVTHNGPGNFAIGSNASLTARADMTVTGGTLSAGNANSTLTGSLLYASPLASTFAGKIVGAGETLTLNNGGSLTLTGFSTYTGQTTLNHGVLTLTSNNQLATSSIVTNMTVTTPGNGGSGVGGTLRLSNNISYNLPLTLGGGGIAGVSFAAPGLTGALDSSTGTNTWAGAITLAGTGSGGTDPLINQVSAAANSTLVLAGTISQAAGVNATLAKSGHGDLVLRGNSPNAYNNLTRLYGGRLIVEKDGALGTAANHTFQVDSASTLAFRAPASSPAGFTYSLQEFLHTDGTGAPDHGQVDNLAGNNTFAGSIAIGGPSNTGSIGVSSGSLTLTGGLYARSGAPSRTINKIGPGTLILAGLSSPTPASSLAVPLTTSTLNVNAGTVDLRSPSPTSANAPGLPTYTVAAGATLLHTTGTLTDSSLTVNGTFQQSTARLQNVALAVNASGVATLHPTGLAPSILSSLTLTGAATLDLTSNVIFIDYASTSPADTVRQYLLNNQLHSTTANADLQNRLTLAYIDASLLPAQSAGFPDATSLLIKTTWRGDANVDGAIDADDFALLDRGHARSLAGWHNGDFNHDNAIDANDFLLIDRVFHQQSASLPSPTFLAHREAQFGGDYVAQLITAIPEPTSLFAACGVALPLLRRVRSNGRNR